MHHRSIETYLALALTSLLIGSGCASQKKQEQAATMEKMQSELSACQSTRSDMEKKMSTLQGKMEEMNARVEESESLAQERDQLYQNLKGELADLVAAGDAEISFRQGLMLVRMPNQVLFESGRYTISQRGESALQEVADALQGVENRHVFVSGHTDNVPISDKAVDFDSNWELSTKRAISALSLLQQAGVDPVNIAAAGFGQYEKIASNDNEAGRAKNRRVELIVLPDLGGVLEGVDEASPQQASDDEERPQTERASTQ